MSNETGSLILLGKDSSMNQTILDLINSNQAFTIKRRSPQSLKRNLERHDSGPIDILIIDILSLPDNTIDAINYLADHPKVEAILAIHIYNRMKLVAPLIEAGVRGYLATDTDEEEMLKAISDLTMGKQYIGI